MRKHEESFSLAASRYVGVVLVARGVDAETLGRKHFPEQAFLKKV